MYSLIDSLTHSFIQQLFVEHLLFTRQGSQHQGDNGKQNRHRLKRETGISFNIFIMGHEKY